MSTIFKTFLFWCAVSAVYWAIGLAFQHKTPIDSAYAEPLPQNSELVERANKASRLAVADVDEGEKGGRARVAPPFDPFAPVAVNTVLFSKALTANKWREGEFNDQLLVNKRVGWATLGPLNAVKKGEVSSHDQQQHLGDGARGASEKPSHSRRHEKRRERSETS